MEFVFAHSMHGPSAFFGFALFLIAIPLCALIVKRNRVRERENALSAELGALKYKAHLEAQAQSTEASATNGAATNGAATNGAATNGAATNGAKAPAPMLADSHVEGAKKS